jgi:hypothetical protein
MVPRSARLEEKSPKKSPKKSPLRRVRLRSHDEIFPPAKSGVCELHNQTMTEAIVPK